MNPCSAAWRNRSQPPKNQESSPVSIVGEINHRMVSLSQNLVFPPRYELRLRGIFSLNHRCYNRKLLTQSFHQKIIPN